MATYREHRHQMKSDPAVVACLTPFLNIACEMDFSIAKSTSNLNAEREKLFNGAQDRLSKLTRNDIRGFSGIVDGIQMLADYTLLSAAPSHLQWLWISSLCSIPVISEAIIVDAEAGINEIVVDNVLGGVDPLARSISLAVVAELCSRLNPDGPHITTQLSIVTKNILALLEDCVSDDYAVARLAATSTLCKICVQWMPTLAKQLGKNPPCSLAVIRELCPQLQNSPKTDADMWRRWTLLSTLAEVGKDPLFWSSLDSSLHRETIGIILDSLQQRSMDECAVALALSCFAEKASIQVVLEYPPLTSRLILESMKILAQERPGKELEGLEDQEVIVSNRSIGMPLVELRWSALRVLALVIGTLLPPQHCATGDNQKEIEDLICQFVQSKDNASSFSELTLLVVAAFSSYASSKGLDARARTTLLPTSRIPPYNFPSVNRIALH